MCIVIIHNNTLKEVLIMLFIKNIFSFVSLLFFVGCVANPYTTSYVSSESQRFSSYRHETVPLEKNQEIKIYSSDNMTRTKNVMLENGYVLLGSSRFNSRKLDDRKAISAARRLGASIVVVQSQYLTSKTRAVPFTTYRPDQRTRIEDIKYDSDGKLESSRETRITVEGEFQTIYVQQTSDYYDYYATFWAKLKNPKIGLYVLNFDDELRREFQTNRGVIVGVVVRNTPAFLADVFPNDVFLYLNDIRINDRRHFFRTVSQHLGQTITLKGYREGEPISIEIDI